MTSLSRDRTSARSYSLEVKTGPDAGARILVGSRAVLVGTHDDCDLALTDQKVSRRHVEIRAVPSGIAVRDLGSTNGTQVDGVRITEAMAGAGSSIRCGDSVLKIQKEVAPLVAPSQRTRFGGLVGESLAMREIFAVLELASPTDATMLVQGESGVGKEVLARAVHDHSARAGGPFVVVDCSAAADQLLESQLFGHLSGAFTGATSDRKGAFVEASSGTVFLDEVGELSPAGQAHLLRVLEARTVQPLGADRPVSVDVRVIAATHRDLLAMVEEKRFRFDLFHRLAVVHLVLPPLRERAEDLPLLVRAFYEGRGGEPGPIEGENLRALASARWAGNVRELRNVLERSSILAQAGTRFTELKLWLEPPQETPIDLVDLSLPFKEAKERWVAYFERRYLAGVYARSEENLTRAAEYAGLTRAHFRALLDGYGLRKK